MKNNATLFYNVCLVIGDAVAIIVAFSVAYILRVTLNHTPISADVRANTYLTILASLVPFWILIFAVLGLYNSRIHEKRFSELGRLIIGSAIGILFVISYAYITNTAIFPARLVTLYGFGLAFFFVFLFRTLARGIRRELFSYGIGINRVLIIGDTGLTRELINSLANTSVTGYKVLGVVGGVKHPLSLDAEVPVYASFPDAILALKGKQLHTIVQTELYANVIKNNEILTYAQEHHVAYRFVPGVTPLGRFLRRTSLDELPQLINVVRGDISLVGPRALIPQELALFAKRHAILSVKSGLTGLAQVSGRRDISFDERRKLDLFYVQNWSFWNDLVIIVKTVWIVLFHKGAM
jgi:FlaA1/EpsC-like NDP-sugar epimerase